MNSIKKSYYENSVFITPKKHSQYKHMSDDKKRDLIFRVMYLGENLRTVCHELEFNFLTGRNLIQKYKKTGEYNSRKKSEIQEEFKEIGVGTTKQTETKPKKSSLGLILVDDTKIQIVSSRNYSEAEEKSMMQLHEYFIHNSIL